MGKDPAVLFYTGDFLAGTLLMRNEQVGKYIKLLCIQHQSGHLSEEDMLEVCGTYDERIFSKFEKDADGLYYNVRMEEETIKRRKYSESRSANRKSTKKQDMNKDMSNHMNEHMSNHMNEHMSNHMGNENGNRIENEYKDEFDILWKLYPRKIGKPSALKSYIKARKKGVSYEEIERGVKAYAEYAKGKDSQYVKQGSTWFNQECWNDDLRVEKRNDGYCFNPDDEMELPY